MRCALKHSPLYPSGLLVRPRSPLLSIPALPASSTNYRRRPLLSLKALHLSSTFEPRRVFECSAASEAVPTPAQQKKLDFYFWTEPTPYGDFISGLFRAFVATSSYIFYIFFTKEALEDLPYPLLFSIIHLAAGVLLIAGSWLVKRLDPPETDLHFWISLFPVSVAHAIWHVATMVSLSKSSLFFTVLMSCAEPVFGMLLSSLFLLRGKWFPLPVYLSVLPIIGGCALAAVTDQNFNMTGFIAAMIASFAYASMDILLEKGIEKKADDDGKKKRKPVTGPNYGTCISILSLLIIAPFSLAIEGPWLWAAGWKKVTLEVEANSILRFLLVQSIMYGMYILKSFVFLPFIHAFPFFTINYYRKMIPITVSIIFVKPIQPFNALGAAIAVLGIFFHYRELCKVFISKTGSRNNIGFLHLSFFLQVVSFFFSVCRFL